MRNQGVEGWKETAYSAYACFMSKGKKEGPLKNSENK